jgi:hypothetical protein
MSKKGTAKEESGQLLEQAETAKMRQPSEVLRLDENSIPSGDCRTARATAAASRRRGCEAEVGGMKEGGRSNPPTPSDEADAADALSWHAREHFRSEDQLVSESFVARALAQKACRYGRWAPLSEGERRTFDHR